MKREAGLGYVELLVAVALLAAIAVPALESLRDALAAPARIAEVGATDALATSRLESVLAMPASTLVPLAGAATTPSALSDAAGSNPRRLVYISRYDAANSDGDGNPYTGGDDSLLWVEVAIENRPFRFATLVAP